MTGHEVAKDAAQAAPAAGYATMHLLGVPLPDWAAILAIIYTVIQIAHVLWRWGRSLHRHMAE